jgi:hypothetical protein
MYGAFVGAKHGTNAGSAQDPLLQHLVTLSPRHESGTGVIAVGVTPTFGVFCLPPSPFRQSRSLAKVVLHWTKLKITFLRTGC